MSRLGFDIMKNFQFFDFNCSKLLKDHLFLSDKKFFYILGSFPLLITYLSSFALKPQQLTKLACF